VQRHRDLTAQSARAASGVTSARALRARYEIYITKQSASVYHELGGRQGPQDLELLLMSAAAVGMRALNQHSEKQLAEYSAASSKSQLPRSSSFCLQRRLTWPWAPRRCVSLGHGGLLRWSKGGSGRRGLGSGADVDGVTAHHDCDWQPKRRDPTQAPWATPTAGGQGVLQPVLREHKAFARACTSWTQ